jgi:cell division protein FtsQ
VTPANRRVSPASKQPRDEVPEHFEAPAATSPPSRVLSMVRTVLGVAILVGTSVGVGWLARRHVMSSPRFAVTSMQIVGNERRPADAVIAESGLVMGQNVFSVDLDVVRLRILADPWMADAVVNRRLPGTLLVRVKERTPAALVVIGDLFLTGTDGEPFKRLEPGDPVDVPLITGVTPESIAEDRAGALRTIRRGIDLAAEYEHGTLARRSPLEEVHVDPGGAFTLVVGRPSTDLVLGGPPFRRKLDEAARVIADLEKRRAKADVIMLDNDARPERVVVRMR